MPHAPEPACCWSRSTISCAIINSQTARTSEAGGVRGAGYGVRGTGLRWGKRIFGRKRHLVVGMQGLILHVHSADGHDRRAAEAVLAP